MGGEKIMSAANVAPPPAPEWFEAYCTRYADVALDAAWWFLYLALAVGVLGALLGVYSAIKNPPPKPDEEGGGGAIGVVTQAVSALVAAFSKAPAWIAMLGAGLILLWFAGDGVPEYCVPAAQQEAESDPDGAGAPGEAADGGEAGEAADGGETGEAAGNEGGG
jgi:hypothetical protein